MGSFILKLLLLCLIAFVIWLCFFTIKRGGMCRLKKRDIVLCLFLAFMTATVFLALEPRVYDAASTQTALQRLQSGQDINLVPFRSISAFISDGIGTTFFINIIGNIVLFIPLGFFLPLLWRRWQRFLSVLLAGLFFSLTIETIQLFIHRSVDIDDILLNTLGVVLGYGIYRLCTRLRPSIKVLAADKKAAVN